MLSTLVLGLTGYAWSQYHALSNGLSTQDVTGPEAPPPLGEQNILVVGLDTRTDVQGNPLPAAVLNQLHAGAPSDGGDTTDTMIVVHIPAGGGQATAISIPRDSYVELAGGLGRHKINAAFPFGKTAAENQLRAKGISGAELETRSDQAGAQAAVQTVEQFTGLTIDHYAAINLAGFYDLSEAVGGVQVCLAAPVHDSYSGADFPAGPQRLSGARALAFVRQRHELPSGDLDRIRRQQAFLAGMANKVLSAGILANPGKLRDLIGALTRAVVIDSHWDVLSFAQQLQKMAAGNIMFETIPIVDLNIHTPDGDAVEVDPQQVQSFVQDQFSAGPRRAVPSPPPTTAPPGRTPASSVTSTANASTSASAGTPNNQPIDASGLTCVN